MRKLTPLWIEDHYDIALSGWGVLNAKLVFFDCRGNLTKDPSLIEDDDKILYSILEPDEKSLLRALDKHRDFIIMVGAHWDFYKDGNQIDPKYKGNPLFKEFYKKYPVKEEKAYTGTWLSYCFTHQDIFGDD